MAHYDRLRALQRAGYKCQRREPAGYRCNAPAGLVDPASGLAVCREHHPHPGA